jgi:hypothetical protein
MGGPSKERRWGETIRYAEQRAARETRFVDDIAACEAWNFRMEGYPALYSRRSSNVF